MAGEVMSLHQLVYVALFLAVVAVILGALGTKAYYDVAHGEGEDQTVNNLTVKEDLTVNDDATIKDTLTVDGASTLTGNVTASGTLAVTGASTLTGAVSVAGALSAPIIKAPVENGDADLTLTEATHAGTIIMQTDVSADRTYTVPDPSAAGVWYHLVGQGSGSSADGHDIIINTDGSVFFDGVINHFDTDVVDNGSTGNAAIVGVWGNGTTHDRLQINVPVGYDIWLIAKSTTVWYVSGWVSSATAPAFSAP